MSKKISLLISFIFVFALGMLPVKVYAQGIDLANYPIPYQIINNGGFDVYYVAGADGGANYECGKKCAELVTTNTGTAVAADGGFYYNYLDVPNTNGVIGIFFPAFFSCTDGSYLGCAPSYPDYESVKPRIIEPTAADRKKDQIFFAAVEKYPQYLAANYPNWAGFVAELDTVYKFADNIYFFYTRSTLPGQTNQARWDADALAFQSLVADGSPSEMNSYRQTGWPGSGSGALPIRGDTGNGFSCGYQPGITVYRYIFCGLNVDPINYIDIPFVGYHWNGYNFCFESQNNTTKKTSDSSSSKYIQYGDIDIEWFERNGWAYDESRNLIYPTEKNKANYYKWYGKTIAEIKNEYNVRGISLCDPWGAQLFIPDEYDNVVIGSWFQLFENFYGHFIQMPF